jgi:hypothetical protein
MLPDGGRCGGGPLQTTGVKYGRGVALPNVGVLFAKEEGKDARQVNATYVYYLMCRNLKINILPYLLTRISF